MNNDNLKNNLVEREILSVDEQKISHLVGSLEKVSAPENFNLRLKARLASADENESRISVWQTLRYVLPLTATAFIAAFLIFQAGIFSSSSNQTEIAANLQIPPTPENSRNLPSNTLVAQSSNLVFNENKSEPKLSESNATDIKSENVSADANRLKKREKISSKSAQNEDLPLSRDSALGESNVKLMPKGLNARKPVSIGREPEKENVSLEAVEVLRFIGVETVFEGKKLKVKSVKENSLAEHSGIKNGDFVEAIDDQKLEQENMKPEFKGGKTLTVLRDGKVLEIVLKPN